MYHGMCVGEAAWPLRPRGVKSLVPINGNFNCKVIISKFAHASYE